MEDAMTELIQREVVLPASPVAVWRALSDPGWLEAWLADEVQLDLRPGGDARFTIGSECLTGWVEEVTPPPADGSRCSTARLVFWWEREGEPASRVSLELADTDGGTRLRVVEARPLQVLDLIGLSLGGPHSTSRSGSQRSGPALVSA
jgi:uncharacterized protein YndB with AHSA1/START domain